MKQLLFPLLALLVLSCKKETVPSSPVVPESLKTYVQTHTGIASFTAIQWHAAKPLINNGKEIGYIIPCMSPSDHQVRKLVVLRQTAGWLCNWQAVSKYTTAAGSSAMSVTMTSLDGYKSFNSYILPVTDFNGGNPLQNSSTPALDISSEAISVNPSAGVIYYNGVPYFMLMGSGASGSPDTPVYYVTTDDPTNGGATGGSIGVIAVNFEYLAEELSLDQTEYLWLFDHAMEASQTYLYLKNSNLPERVTVAKEHLHELIYNAAYLQLAGRHTQTGNPQLVWWIDDQWLDNPGNFTLNADKDNPREASKLNAEERVLVSLYPVQAGIINLNVDEAYEMSTSRMGIGTNKGINDKKDAFRHAFFQAINVRDVPSRVIPYVSADNIVKAFAIAHESEVPPQLMLEKAMDLFNNDIGIEYGKTIGYFTSNETVANTIQQKLMLGLLRYLSPLDIDSHPYFDPSEPTSLVKTNGIIPGVTVMTPTNQ